MVKRANIAVTSTVMAITTVIPLALTGVITIDLMVRSAALLIPFVGAIILGGRLFRKANDRIYRLFALWLLVVIGLTVALL